MVEVRGTADILLSQSAVSNLHIQHRLWSIGYYYLLKLVDGTGKLLYILLSLYFH